LYRKLQNTIGKQFTHFATCGTKIIGRSNKSGSQVMGCGLIAGR